MSKENIETDIKICLVFVNNAIERNELTGTSSPPPVAVNRLRAFESMLDNAVLNILNKAFEAALTQLESALLHCNGQKTPKDFVQGSARSDIALRIVMLITSIRLEIQQDQAYGGLKAQGQF